MSTFRTLALVCITLLPSVAQLSQTLPNGFMNVDGPSSTPYIVNNQGDMKWHWVYDSAQFAVNYQIIITEISVRAAAPANVVNAFSFANLSVTLASSNNNYTAATYNTNYAANMGTDATLVRTGPWASPSVPANPGMPTATWIPMGLTQPFTFDPTLGKDLIVQITKCGAPTTIWGTTQMDGASAAAGLNGGNRYGTLNNCTSATWSFSNNEFVPIIKIDYLPGAVPTMWQVNTPNCMFNINGAMAQTFSAAQSSRCIGATSLASVGVTAGLPFDIAVQFAPTVSSISGGITFPTGQVFNLVFGHPTMFFVNGGLMPSLFPSPGAFAIPFGTLPGTLGAQVLCVDPTQAGGFALSQAGELTGQTSLPSIPGPTGDDTSTSHVLGLAPLCGPSTVPFYGTSHTLIHVISNGRAMFGTNPDTSFTATATAATTGNPFWGAWCDLNFLPGISSVSVSAPSLTQLRVDYTNMVYWGTPVQNTFALLIDSSTGMVQLDGLSGLLTGPVPAPNGTSLNMFLGISPGAPLATNAGPTVFAVGGPNAGPTGGGMIYAYGNWGSLHTGINNITFLPNINNNYDWAAF
jgi:hypothetical protein